MKSIVLYLGITIHCYKSNIIVTYSISQYFVTLGRYFFKILLAKQQLSSSKHNN